MKKISSLLFVVSAFIFAAAQTNPVSQLTIVPQDLLQIKQAEYDFGKIPQGKPVYTYSYREAVLDGVLVDYEPPILIKTVLSEGGITWKVASPVKIYSPSTSTVEEALLPDELSGLPPGATVLGQEGK